jgi:hypothetical protein
MVLFVLFFSSSTTNLTVFSPTFHRPRPPHGEGFKPLNAEGMDAANAAGEDPAMAAALQASLDHTRETDYIPVEIDWDYTPSRFSIVERPRTMADVRELISFDVVSADDTFNVEVVWVKEFLRGPTVVIQGRLKDAHSQSPTRAYAYWTLHYNIMATDQKEIDISASESTITPSIQHAIAESVMMRYMNGSLGSSLGYEDGDVPVF